VLGLGLPIWEITVASQRAGAAGVAGAEVFETAIGGRGDVVTIEIDEVRLLLDAMGIVAGGAGGAGHDDVKLMATRLAVGLRLSARGLEALVAQNAGAVVALVTERVVAGSFGRVIGQQKLAFENRGKGGPVRSISSDAPIFRPLVVVVAIGASDQAGGGPGRNQAGHVGISAGLFERVERLVGSLKLQAFVGSRELARDTRRSAVGAFSVATEAELVFPGGWIDHGTGGIDSFDAEGR